MTIAVVDGGLFHRSIIAALGREVTFIPICALPMTNLMRYDVVVVLSHTNEQILYECKESLARFLRWGGVLVIVGFRCYERSFVPYARFHATELLPTAANCDNDDCRFLFGPPIQIAKTGIHAHGFFDGIPAHSVIVSGDPQGRPHTVIVRNPDGGSILLTTLDPDFHIHSLETTFASRDNCRIVLERILVWAEKESQRAAPPALRPLRSAIAFLASRKLRLRVLLVLSILVTGVLSIIIYNDPSNQLYAAIATATSIVAFVIALLEFRGRK